MQARSQVTELHLLFGGPFVRLSGAAVAVELLRRFVIVLRCVTQMAVFLSDHSGLGDQAAEMLVGFM